MLAKNEEIEALKRKIEDAHPEWRKPKHALKSIQNVLQMMLQPEGEPVEEYAKDPWWIMRVVASMYKTAEQALLREGFESFAPTYKVLGQTPLRMIPPKKRHQSNLYRRELRKRRFDVYLFIRRLFGNYDLNRLFDLDGCGSVVMVASSFALVYDFEIELMRLAEADGAWDDTSVETHRGYKITRLPEQRWTGESKIVGRLDDSIKTVLFVNRMGRIARIISQAERP